ncbi:MAG: hypothetical protein R2912_11325 [Eubacteriales bacterium]
MKTLLQIRYRIYDGTGAEAFTGDILMEDDKILAVGQTSARMQPASIWQARASPPVFLMRIPITTGLRRSKTRSRILNRSCGRGITSFITGNCGLSMTGFSKDSPFVDKVGAGLFHMDGLTGVYNDIDALFAAIDGNTLR